MYRQHTCTDSSCESRCYVLGLQIMRSFSTAERVTGANHYVLRVSPGTDYALMIAFCVVIDELFNE